MTRPVQLQGGIQLVDLHNDGSWTTRRRIRNPIGRGSSAQDIWVEVEYRYRHRHPPSARTRTCVLPFLRCPTTGHIPYRSYLSRL